MPARLFCIRCYIPELHDALLELGANCKGENLWLFIMEITPQFIATLNELASMLKERLHINFHSSCKNVTQDQRDALRANGTIVRTY